MIWHLISGEYPPQLGGVSDYTRLVARGLAAAGDEVHVWAPRCQDEDGTEPGIAIHRLPGIFGPRALAVLGRALERAPQDRVLVQYVPHAYGMKAMNLPFCLWLYAQRRRGTMVMFHEVMFPFERRQPLRHNALGAVTWVMALLVARAAGRIFVATPIWERILPGRAAVKGAISWLPLPSNIPVVDDPQGVKSLKHQYARNGGLLLGHFGTYASHITQELRELLPTVLADHPKLAALLIGANSCDFRCSFVREHPKLGGRVQATGTLPAEELSRAVSTCDLMVQPYADGASTRRTSLMTALAHGRAVITNSGIATEPLWAETRAVALVPAGDLDRMRVMIAQLLANTARRVSYSEKANQLYARRFDLRHTVAALRLA